MVVCFDTSIQIFFHSCLVGKNLSVLSGDFRLLVSVRAVGAHTPCKRPRIRNRFLHFSVIPGVFVNVVAHLIDPVAADMAVILAFLPFIRGVLNGGGSCIFNRFVKQKRISRLLFPCGGLLLQIFKNSLLGGCAFLS